MNGKAKKSMRKVLPVGIAMGILFSASPVTEYKVKADVDTFATIVTTFGDVYDKFLKEPFGDWLEKLDAQNSYAARLENVAYKAPTFNKGEFGISVFDYHKDQNFSKKIKIAYTNGKFEYKTIKHGQQIRIKDAGTIVDLTPDEPELSKHDILYITQKQLDEGNTGVSLTNFKTYYLKSDNRGNRNVLAGRFELQEFPGYFLNNGSGVRDIRYVNEDLFSKLPEEKRILATITSEPVGKDVLENYVKNDHKARADLYDRLSDILAESTHVLETPIALPFNALNHGNPYQIIPYKKGTNKVVVKTGSKYLSGKEGKSLQYSDSIGDDEVFELVQTGNSHDNKFQFYLKNKNGVSLAGNLNTQQFGTDWSFKSEIRFTGKSNNEINNWLIEWYPGKENERQKYDEVQAVADEKDSTKWVAKDSSGNVIKNSWVNRGSGYSFTDAEGFILTGWQEIKGKTYYFSAPYGYMVAGNTSAALIEDKEYYFNDDGVLQRSTWEGDAYADASGAFVKEGLKEIDGKIYYFQDYNVNKKEIRLEEQNIILHFSDKGVLERASRINGEAIDSDVYASFENKSLVFNKDGSIWKTGINKKGQFQAYYSLEDGDFYTGWKMIGDKRYYFINGYNSAFNRYEDIDGKRYYFHEDGSVNKAGFEKIDGKLYHFDNNGVAQTGWQTIDNNYYYFDENGAAKTGWFNVGGGYRPWPLAYGYLWYCAKEDGSLYADGWFKIDGKDYQFDKWGHKM
ncbi:cell wall-binding protein [Bacillus sp. AFS054943]|uniref:Cell wall-binding protein n=1 Tax=Bacillus cereus TaxID=1396 RepID=A0A2C1LND8_BACCE|nr:MULTISPECIES: cell wall-binding protein [Bacillus]PGL85675.1 cell wall-binding protein [Bacillus sp. AFS054943]PGT99451.1 cell wall-binding protein [Bacillus cereus]